MKKVAIAIWLSAILAAILLLFWNNELVYSLPTPVPKNYKAIALGEKIDISAVATKAGHPVFFHFFNPDCPCSRFNINHFKLLEKEYGQKASFVVVAMTSNSQYTESSIQKMFNLQLPVLFDSSIAKKCGVYSTPQAVIIDANQQLYFRGNYNRARYCSDKKTEYARMALDSLFTSVNKPSFDAFALKAYGCQLPKCSK